MIEFLSLLIGVNVVIAVGYFLISLLMLLAPVKLKFLRKLGYWGGLFAFFTILFFIGCGAHHLEMGLHIDLLLNDGVFDESILHFLIPDAIQALGAFGAVLVGYFKGSQFLNCLLDQLAAHKAGEEDLIDNEAHVLDRK